MISAARFGLVAVLGGVVMTDAVFIAATIVFFAIAASYVAGCRRLG